MLSELTQAMIVNGAVLGAVLEADLGGHRKVGRIRILRPVLLAAGVVPLFMDAPATHGSGLALEIGAALAGLLCGILAIVQMTVYRSPSTGKPVTRAGAPYALLWTAVIGARAAFSYGSVHWFPTQLTHWAVREHLNAAAITDSLIFMAVAMLLTRTVALGVRASRLSANGPTVSPTGPRMTAVHS
ncbi:hypothetical protein [Streptacidiphilus sp. P02-A3a]|uniref:hypothetical protein n=1 Tax=Streptacidiphilus sp. P02-A3a TaxID=2704468 RepID=UPI0015FE4D0D|nr:hypothetical protein [Streptacidiphilus sp. P02-A3a]QMU73412.1 hypothetical protein GXP74_39515 [Streptacidiphilus sp. P02-A3a]